MFVVLKIPIIAALWLIWYAIQEPEPADGRGAARRRLRPRARARAAAPASAAARPPRVAPAARARARARGEGAQDHSPKRIAEPVRPRAPAARHVRRAGAVYQPASAQPHRVLPGADRSATGDACRPWRADRSAYSVDQARHRSSRCSPRRRRDHVTVPLGFRDVNAFHVLRRAAGRVGPAGLLPRGDPRELPRHARARSGWWPHLRRARAGRHRLGDRDRGQRGGRGGRRRKRPSSSPI